MEGKLSMSLYKSLIKQKQIKNELSNNLKYAYLEVKKKKKKIS